MKAKLQYRGWAIACCALLTGCGGNLFGDAKDESPRVYYESQAGELVESPYTLQQLANALEVTRGHVQRQGNEWIRFGERWEVSFRVIGLDRVLVEKVEDYTLRERIANAQGAARDQLEQERISTFAPWMVPERFIDRIYSEEPEARHTYAIKRLNGRPTHR